VSDSRTVFGTHCQSRARKMPRSGFVQHLAANLRRPKAVSHWRRGDSWPNKNLLIKRFIRCSHPLPKEGLPTSQDLCYEALYAGAVRFSGVLAADLLGVV
jgi:hypothetical protein